MSLTRYEQETIILFNEEEKTASVYTCNKTLMKRLDGFCLQNTACTLEKQDQYSKTYIIPKKWIKVQMPRILTDEQKAKLAEHAKVNFGH